MLEIYNKIKEDKSTYILDVFDILTALKALLNETTLDGADISGDGKLTLIDVLQLLKAVAA